MEKLSENLEKALVDAMRNVDTTSEMMSIRQLLLMGYLTIKINVGWIVTDKGNDYIEFFKLLEPCMKDSTTN